MAGIHVWNVPLFGRQIPSHQLVLGYFGLLTAAIGYSIFKPKNYDVKKYVEGLPKDKQEILKNKNIKI